jgi:hypothetical protein
MFYIIPLLILSILAAVACYHAYTQRDENNHH